LAPAFTAMYHNVISVIRISFLWHTACEVRGLPSHRMCIVVSILLSFNMLTHNHFTLSVPGPLPSPRLQPLRHCCWSQPVTGVADAAVHTADQPGRTAATAAGAQVGGGGGGGGGGGRRRRRRNPRGAVNAMQPVLQPCFIACEQDMVVRVVI